MYAFSFYSSKKCFGLVQFFCARPKIYLPIVAVTNILCQTKYDLHSEKLFFVPAQMLDALKFLGWLKKFGLAQNILELVKGQGIKL